MPANITYCGTGYEDIIGVQSILQFADTNDQYQYGFQIIQFSNDTLISSSSGTLTAASGDSVNLILTDNPTNDELQFEVQDTSSGHSATWSSPLSFSVYGGCGLIGVNALDEFNTSSYVAYYGEDVQTAPSIAIEGNTSSLPFSDYNTGLWNTFLVTNQYSSVENDLTLYSFTNGESPAYVGGGNTLPSSYAMSGVYINTSCGGETGFALGDTSGLSSVTYTQSGGTDLTSLNSESSGGPCVLLG